MIFYLTFCETLCYAVSMFTYRGRVVNDQDIAFINELIAQNPDDSR